jgi:hypothetical protein
VHIGEVLPDLVAGVRLWAGSRLLAPAAIAALPKWMRHMGGFDQSATVDAAVTPAARATVRALSVRDSRPLLAAAARTVTPAEVRQRRVANA